MSARVWALAVIGAAWVGCAAREIRPYPIGEAAEAEAAAALDAFHEAASKADEARYFSLIAEDGVFLGTDASERWTKAEFLAFAHPFFAAGTGWTYRPVERHLSLSADGRLAWFDERLENAKLGDCRGSGVLRRSEAGWRIVQYNLTIPIPNELADEIVGRIMKAGGDPPDPP